MNNTYYNSLFKKEEVPKDKKRDVFVQLQSTYRCNNTCRFCMRRGILKKIPKDMTFSQVTTNLDLVAKNYSGKKFLTLTGGETSIRNDFLDILEYANRLEFKVILHTNAMAFSDRALSQKVSMLIYYAFTAFHSHNSLLETRIVRGKSTFAQKVQGILNLIESRVPIVTNTVIVKQNYKYLPQIASFIAKFFHPKVAFLTFVFPRGVLDKEVFRLLPTSFRDVKQYFIEAMEILENTGTYVLHNGSFPLCLFSDEPEKIIKLIRNMKAFQREKLPFHGDRIFIDINHQEDEYGKYALPMDRELCANCDLIKVCWGYWKEYISLIDGYRPAPIRVEALWQESNINPQSILDVVPKCCDENC